MKKICFLTSTLNYGGATKIMIELANYCSDFFEVSIVNYGDSTQFYKIESNITVFQAPKTSCNVPKIRLLTQMRLIRKYFRDKDFDLIIAFGNTEKLMALSASIGRKSKVLISERQDPYNYVPGKKHTMWLRYILSDGCVFQTIGAMKYFPKIVQDKSVVIPNFIKMESRKFVPFSKKKKEISFSARFELKQKRQDVMVKAMTEVVKRYPDWKLVFYGDGEDKPIIEKMVADEKISDNVIFAGKVSNVNNYIYDSAMMVLTSDYEGIPNVIIEAMAIGVPVISTDCSPGGAKLLIQNYKNGILVPVGDSSSIAEAISKMIDNPELADKCAQSGLNVRSNYSPEHILPKWIAYINQVLRKQQ